MINIIYYFKIFNFYDDGEGDWHLKGVSNLQFFVFNKGLEDGTLMPKHVGVGT